MRSGIEDKLPQIIRQSEEAQINFRFPVLVADASVRAS
jgi:hypothetical protein